MAVHSVGSSHAETMSPDSAVASVKSVLRTETANGGVATGADSAAMVSHDGALCTDTLAPVVVTLTVCVGGKAPPPLAVNANAAGATSIARSEGSTRYATGRSKVRAAPCSSPVANRTLVD